MKIRLIHLFMLCLQVCLCTMYALEGQRMALGLVYLKLGMVVDRHVGVVNGAWVLLTAEPSISPADPCLSSLHTLLPQW